MRKILCENNPISTIKYQLVDGATGATVTGLPAGVSLNVASGIATISGTPSDRYYYSRQYIPIRLLPQEVSVVVY